MPLVYFDSLDLVPDGLKDVAKAVEGQDGKVSVNVVPTSKVDEFRDKNIALSKERDSLLDQVKPLKELIGDNVEDFRKNLEELRQTQQRVRDGELKETRAIEEALGKRTEELRKDYDTRLQTVGKDLAAWRDKYGVLDTQYRRSLVASAIKDAAMLSDSGVEPSAIEDITRLGHEVFRVTDDGKVVPMEGDAPIYGADGVSPMTPKEWLAKLKETKGYFFKQSNGGGAGGDTTRKVLGIDAKKLATMTAAEKLALANEHRGR